MCFKYFGVLTGKKCYLETKHRLLKMTDSLQLFVLTHSMSKESKSTACPQNAGHWKHCKNIIKVQVIKDNIKRPQFIYGWIRNHFARSRRFL